VVFTLGSSAVLNPGRFYAESAEGPCWSCPLPTINRTTQCASFDWVSPDHRQRFVYRRPFSKGPSKTGHRPDVSNQRGPHCPDCERRWSAWASQTGPLRQMTVRFDIANVGSLAPAPLTRSRPLCAADSLAFASPFQWAGLIARWDDSGVHSNTQPRLRLRCNQFHGRRRTRLLRNLSRVATRRFRSSEAVCNSLAVRLSPSFPAHLNSNRES